MIRLIKLNRTTLKKYSSLKLVLLVIAFLITVTLTITGSYVYDNETVAVGMISPKRFVALKDTEDVEETNKRIEQAKASVGPLYQHDTEVQNKTIEDLNQFFHVLDQAVQEMEENEGTAKKNITLNLPVVLNKTDYEAYKELSLTGKQQFQKNIFDAVNNLYEQGVTEESMEKLADLANSQMTDTQWNNTLQNMALQIITSAIKPNLILDNEAMEAAIVQKVSEVEPVMIKKNQKIVDQGEVITEDIYNRLMLLNLINQGYSSSVIPLVGSVLIEILLFLAVALYVSTQAKKLIIHPVPYVILFCCYVLSLVAFGITAKMNNFRFVPVQMFAMFVSILIGPRIALVLNLFVSIVGTFIFNGNIDYIIYFLLSGSFAALLMQYASQRKKVVMISVAVGLSDAALMIALELFMEKAFSTQVFIDGIYAGFTGLLTVIVVMGSMPLWEAIFEVNTPLRLLELINPNNELMRRLMIEAPGTYHHSLIVANLAENAAYDVEANPTLARAGAYYHDIGKLGYPLCFSENQAGTNAHDGMEPSNSARVIIKHVELGKTLADEYKVPTAIKEILEQHHGTTLVKYFYYKAVNLYGKDNVNKEDFRYPGPIPQSKESAIVMLADTVEAAVRSNISNGKTLDEVKELIDILIRDKLDEGQLDSCDLTLKDITLIKEAFMKVFQGMYHDRISYPKEALEDARKHEEKVKKIEQECESKTEKEGICDSNS